MTEKLFFCVFFLIFCCFSTAKASFWEAGALFGLLKVFDNLQSLTAFFYFKFLFKKLLTTVFI